MYTSCFGGELEAVRDAIEGPLPPGVKPPPIMLKDMHDQYYHVKRTDASNRLFKHGTILEPLFKLKGVAEYVNVRGDLPQAYMDRLTTSLSNPNPAPATKKKLLKEQAVKQARPKEPSMHDFFRELAVKNRQEGDHGAADLCEQMTRTTVKSPGVMEELFRPPTKERLDAWRDRRRSRDLVIDESTDDRRQQCWYRYAERETHLRTGASCGHGLMLRIWDLIAASWGECTTRCSAGYASAVDEHTFSLLLHTQRQGPRISVSRPGNKPVSRTSLKLGRPVSWAATENNQGVIICSLRTLVTHDFNFNSVTALLTRL